MQGEKWSRTYDPNSMLVISKAMDLFTMAKTPCLGEEGLEEGMRPIQMAALVMGAQSDILFPCWQQKQIADLLRRVGNK